MNLVMYSNSGRTVLHTFSNETVTGEELLNVLRTCVPWDSNQCDTNSDLRVNDSQFTVWCGLRFEPNQS